MIGAVIGFAAMCAAAEDPVFTSPVYQCKIFNRYSKNSGLFDLTLGDKILISDSRLSATLKGADGEKIKLTEKADPEYGWKDNELTSRKTMVSQEPNAEPYAEVSRKIQFSDKKIRCEIVIRNLRDMTFAETWTCYREVIKLTTETLMGMRLDGVLMDDQVISTAVPRKFDKKKWGFTKTVKKLTLTGQDQSTITVTAAPNCKLQLIHYGGKYMELYVRPEVRRQELEQKAGQKTPISYTIEFGKSE